MKRVLQIIIALLLFISSAPAVFAEGNVRELSWYGRVSLGFAAQVKKYVEVNMGETEWDYDSGMNYSVSAGYTLPHFALEGEFAYRKLDVGRRISRGGGSVRYTGDQTQVSFMVNGYFIPRPEWEVSPYFGLGIGTTFVSWNDVMAPGGSFIIDDSDTVFTYQLIAGASYKITPEFTIEADYRYLAPGDVEIDLNGDEGKLDNQELNIFGIALKFRL